MLRPLFDAGRRPRRTAEPLARGVDAPRPDTARTPWRAAAGNSGEPIFLAAKSRILRACALRTAGKIGGTGLSAASTVAFAICLLSAPAFADALTLTTLRQAQLEDPKDAIAPIMRTAWAGEIAQIKGTYLFTYALFEAGGDRYLVSSIRSGLTCRPDECDWQVQRLDASYKVLGQAKRVLSCGAENGVAVTNGELTICDKKVELP